MDPSPISTRDRIIECAGEIFGQKGFKGTTIRMISEAAGVNVAAINYHFKGKQGLYEEVIESIFSTGFKRFPSIPSKTDTNLTPEQQLKFFIKGNIYRMLSTQGWGGKMGKGRLLAKEMLEPTPALNSVVERYMRPHKEAMAVIIRQITGENAGDEDILLCLVSIMAQCIYYVFAVPIIERLAPEYCPLEDNMDSIVEHVFNFSMKGLSKFESDMEES